MSGRSVLSTGTCHDIGVQVTLAVWIFDGQFGKDVMVVVRGSDWRKDYRTHHSFGGFLAEKNTLDGLLIASKDFSRIFMDATNDVLRNKYCRMRSVFAFLRFT